jgi:hypothetical protein
MNLRFSQEPKATGLQAVALKVKPVPFTRASRAQARSALR